MLDLENVYVNISEFPILRGVTLSVPPGEIVGVVGRNGAGKTTLLRSIMGLVTVQRGAIRLAGRNLLHLPPHERARLGLGYMPEDRRLIGDLSVEENILLPAWAQGQRDSKPKLDWVYRLLPELDGLRHRPANWLSGGQQKLLALARALMSGTTLLLLDEPFEGVAPSLAHRLNTVISTLKEEGRTALLAESDPRRISAIAGRIYAIERGEIVA